MRKDICMIEMYNGHCMAFGDAVLKMLERRA